VFLKKVGVIALGVMACRAALSSAKEWHVLFLRLSRANISC
jgi:hypothetical protein